MKFTRGSEWRQWDLHLHTPSSYDYENKSITNEEIIKVLKENDITVVAITDHNVIDIDRIKDLKSLATNQITILPGIELRSIHGGSDSIHYICIFPENINLDTLKSKFMGVLNLTEEDVHKEGHEMIARNLVDAVNITRSLGGIVTIHAGKKSNSVENITNSLPYKMAIKKDIFNNVDIYEVGKIGDIEDYRNKVFPVLKKEIPTIICSDNHNIRNYHRKEKLWIKADPTFDGLKHAIKEPILRFCVGEIPEKEIQIHSNLEKYIDSVVIQGKEGNNTWFEQEILLNSNLVTIIGNKGNGKSALADIIGYAGNTKNNMFSFLSKERFNMKPENLGKNYDVILKWRNGHINRKNLFLEDSQELEKVKYLPQKYIELVCNDLSNGFNNEIERLIFDYLPDEEKFKTNNFIDLINYITKEIKNEITNFKAKLEDTNLDIINKESLITNDKKIELNLEIKNKYEELELQRQRKPLILEKPVVVADIEKELLKLNNDKLEYQNIIKVKQEQLSLYTKRRHIITENIRKINKIEFTFKNEVDQINQSLSSDGIDIIINAIVNIDYNNLEIHLNEIEDNIETLKQEISSEKNYIDSKDNIFNKLKVIDNRVNEIKRGMSEKQIQYQKNLEDNNLWETKILKISNELTDLDTRLEIVNDKIPQELDELYKQRKLIIQNIFNLKLKLKDEYEKRFKFVKDVISDLSISEDEKPDFSINLNMNNEYLVEELLGRINQKMSSIFRGKEQGKETILRLSEEVDINDFSSLYIFIENISESLKDTSSEIYKNKVEFYNTLFSLDYIDITYMIYLGDKPVNQLSPGERGLLLLIFYLILDKENIPLIIDQPEDNLDNQSIYLRLVPFIRESKQRRQIIIVTHNPNIAVACDSEQIIYGTFDKSKKQIRYISGSLESGDINILVLDVLEGTEPAFIKRSNKYFG